MNATHQIKLVQCIVHCLRPMARMMMRSGIGYPQFAELAKRAFVHEALADKDARGRATNLSRVAIRTGISRKEVAKLNASGQVGSEPTALKDAVDFRSLHAARVLQLWHMDSRFVGRDGSPMALPCTDEPVSFNALVKAAGGDVPAGAVRAELLAAGAIVELERGELKAVKRYFVSADVGEELLVGFTHMVIPVLEGLARNTDARYGAPFIQRLVYTDRLSPDAVPVFRRVARDRVTSFVQSVDDWLSSNETADAEPDNPYRYGIGVFYYEGQPSVPVKLPDSVRDSPAV